MKTHPENDTVPSRPVKAESQNINPAVLKEVYVYDQKCLDPTKSGYVDKAHLSTCALDKNLSGRDSQALHTLLSGFQLFSHAGDSINQDANRGISLQDMQIIDRAINRTNPIDPIREDIVVRFKSGGDNVGRVIGGLAGFGLRRGIGGIAIGALAGDLIGRFAGNKLAESSFEMKEADAIYDQQKYKYQKFIGQLKLP